LDEDLDQKKLDKDAKIHQFSVVKLLFLAMGLGQKFLMWDEPFFVAGARSDQVSHLWVWKNSP